MIAKFAKSAETVQILRIVTDFVFHEIYKNHEYHKICKNCKIREFLCETKDHLPKKITPIFVFFLQMNVKGIGIN